MRTTLVCFEMCITCALWHFRIPLYSALNLIDTTLHSNFTSYGHFYGTVFTYLKTLFCSLLTMWGVKNKSSVCFFGVLCQYLVPSDDMYNKITYGVCGPRIMWFLRQRHTHRPAAMHSSRSFSSRSTILELSLPEGDRKVGVDSGTLRPTDKDGNADGSEIAHANTHTLQKSNEEAPEPMNPSVNRPNICSIIPINLTLL